jgi:hypothetical protein
MASARRKRTYSTQLPKRKKPRGAKTVRIPITREAYDLFVDDIHLARTQLDQQIVLHPELFPEAIKYGYKFNGFTEPSKKLDGLRRRRIELTADREGYTIAPSFVMPYMTAYTSDVDKALLLVCFGVPCWVLTQTFGRNDQYWYRLAVQFGHNSIVGTTVKDPDRLPTHLLADEKHTWENGHKRFIALTIGGSCILGAAFALDAGTDALTKAYGRFAEEIRNVRPTYRPDSVNLDGWAATKAAWLVLFPSVYVVLCFLHGFLKIRNRCKHLGVIFQTISTLVWDAYRAKDPESFRVQIDELRQTAAASVTSAPGLEAILKLCNKSTEYAEAYSHPGAYRTSTSLDQIMDRIDRIVYANKYFHGHTQSSDDRVRALALLHNFRPYCPRSKISKVFSSPAHRLNGSVYADNWLENLLVSGSMCGFRQPPQIPLE